MRSLIYRLPRLLGLALGALGLAVMTLAGCGATQPDDNIGETEFTFLLNGERWTASIPTRAVIVSSRLVVSSELLFSNRFPLRQAAGFAVPWRGVGAYPISQRIEDGDTYTGYISESDGDATNALYLPTGPAAERGGFEVTRYDEVTGEIEGRFEGIFVVTPLYLQVKQRELPDTLRVTEGRFRAVLEDRR